MAAMPGSDLDPVAAAIAERLVRVQGRIGAAAAAAGRDLSRVRVVAVTKDVGPAEIAAARRAGLDRFGESRIRDALDKVAAEPDVEWHLVGHLQSNKARPAVETFAWIQSIDSVDLLRRVDSLASELGKRPTLLLQVNLTGAPTQHGFDAARFAAESPPAGQLARVLAGLQAARVVGLMGIGPLANEAEASRAAFASLRRLAETLEQATGVELRELSMGMSGDLEAAVAEGATMVRIGTALFGERPRATAILRR